MQKGDVLGLVFLGAGVLLLAAFFMFANDAPEIAYAPVEVPGSAMSVPEGQASLTSVDVNVTIAKPGFITIHRAISTAPGPIVGTSSLVDVGEQTVTLALTEAMTPGFTYIALLHVDDGDGIFVVNDDLPVAVDGNVLRVDFKAAGESLLIPTE